ncbi:MAG: hypothetical protein ACR2O1_12820 [Boseongicola sp.]
MSELLNLSFNVFVVSAVSCLILREVIIFALPKSLVGPGGRFIDTDRRG